MLSTEVKRDNESLMIQNQSLVCVLKPDVSFSFQLAWSVYTASCFSMTKISTEVFCTTLCKYPQAGGRGRGGGEKHLERKRQQPAVMKGSKTQCWCPTIFRCHPCNFSSPKIWKNCTHLTVQHNNTDTKDASLHTWQRMFKQQDVNLGIECKLW